MTQSSQSKPGISLRLSLSLMVGTIAALLLAGVLLGSYLIHFRLFSIPSAAMEPSIFVGDRIIVRYGYYNDHPITDGDLIAFHHEDTIILKRVSALPGESIEGRGGVLYRNGAALDEPYVQFSKDAPLPEIETFPLRTVPPGEVFVTGDNRDHSLDSRSSEYGPVHISDIVGRVTYVYLSKHPGQTGRSF